MSNISIDALAREERNAYQREWRQNNKQRVKIINDRYWQKRAEKKLAEQRHDNGRLQDISVEEL